MLNMYYIRIAVFVPVTRWYLKPMNRHLTLTNDTFFIRCVKRIVTSLYQPLLC